MDHVDDDAPSQWIYRNLTPWRIHARFDDDGELLARGRTDVEAKVLAIPALGEVTLPKEEARELNTLSLRLLGQVEVRPASSELWSSMPQAIVILGWLTVFLVFGGWALFFGGGSAVPWAWALATAVLVPVIALAVASARELLLYDRFTRYRTKLCQHDGSSQGRKQSLEGVERGSRIRAFVDAVPRHAAEFAVLVGAVVVSVVGLGVAIQLTTQLKELLPIDYGALLQLDDPFEDVTELAQSSPAFWQMLVGHIAQWVLVSVAALAPAAMYFQFDRERLASVQRRWLHEVFRLDTTVRTVRDVEARYGSQIESSFGVLGPDSRLRLRGGRRSPVIVATVLLVVGWFLVISATQVPRLVEAEVAGGGTEYVWPTADGGVPAPGETTTFPVPSFFRPELSLVGYAFLGTYVFTLFHVLRGYQRRDLHPRTYNTIVARILAAYALALVVSVVYDGAGAEVLMFFVGFTPQSAIVWLREQLARDRGVWTVLPLHEPAPLTDLEGIDLYDRTRLSEEGINNVEALAHADIVDLMSSTRISAAQLVDWTDQAILYLRVGGDAQAQVSHAQGFLDRLSDSRSQGEEPATRQPPVALDAPDVRANLCHLRSFGIRTATDLIEAYDEALRRAGTDVKRQAAEVNALRAALELRDPKDPQVCSIQTIIDTLPDEEWFVHVRNWRRTEFGAADAWYWYLDGHDWDIREAVQPKHVKRALEPFTSVPMVELDGVPGGSVDDPEPQEERVAEQSDPPEAALTWKLREERVDSG